MPFKSSAIFKVDFPFFWLRTISLKIKSEGVSPLCASIVDVVDIFPPSSSSPFSSLGHTMRKRNFPRVCGLSLLFALLPLPPPLPGATSVKGARRGKLDRGARSLADLRAATAHSGPSSGRGWNGKWIAGSLPTRQDHLGRGEGRD